MSRVKYLSAVILLAAASSAYAQTTAPLPGDQGAASVNKNLAKNPENKGLQNASGQLEQNRLKHAEQEQKRIEQQERYMEKKTERVETRAQHHDTPTRPTKAERPGK